MSQENQTPSKLRSIVSITLFVVLLGVVLYLSGNLIFALIDKFST